MLKTQGADGLLALKGEAGYDGTGEFEQACEALLHSKTRPVVMDLSDLRVIASPCVARVYDVSRRIGYGQVTVRVSPEHQTIFAPGEVHGLFKLEVAEKD